MACVLAVALLVCMSSAQAQVIEEGGFPVKGQNISGDSFSLSCPLRLVARAGASIPFSCAAEGISEEVVHYRWEAVSGDDLRLLSDAQSQAPFFTAPVSGGREYTYRLTAMASGVYRTATVTVTVQGASGETVGTPGLQDECDPLAIPDEPGQGCVPWEREPEPFGYGPESEGGFLFPEVSGLPDREGGLDSQSPPRLECPAAVFLDELETGAIECLVSDASGEEYLEYAWEPVGSTTRDYLDNPRLIPEDSPTPSVIAPEAPVYETLESFRSGETTFRYRYRLTAASHVTGLSSSSEVEVFVSSSRPSVYCPLEVVVEEGETVPLNCEGVDPLSLRMDYDEDAASVLWEWEGLWGTSTAPLAATELSSPLFTAPPGSVGKEYHYIASMTTSASGAPRTARRRVTIRVVEGREGAQAAGDAVALANRGRAPSIDCEDKTLPDVVPYFGTPYTYDFVCSVTDEPDDPTYLWEGTQANRLTRTDALQTTLNVWDITTNNKNQQTQDFTFTVTLSAPDLDDDVTGTVTITLEESQIICWITDTSKLQPYYEIDVDEGGSNEELTTCEGGITSLDGGPYEYRWHSSVPPASGNLSSLLTNRNQQTSEFIPPDDVPRDIQYNISVYVTRPSEPRNPINYDATSFRVTVENLDPVDCPAEYAVYEGDPAFTLDCTDKGTLSGVTWQWSPTTHLTNTGRVNPTFTPPADVPLGGEQYRYTVRAMVSGVDRGGSEVAVRVRRRTRLSVFCSPSSYRVFEGAGTIQLDCEGQGVAGGNYNFVWTPRGSTTNTDLLNPSQHRGNRSTPVFSVPEEVDSDQTYEYTVTASLGNARDGSADVTVTVLNKPSLGLVCTSPPPVYEGDPDFDLDCTASNAPVGSDYEYEWTGRGSTVVPGRLNSTTIEDPTFRVPDNVDSDETYEYRLKVSADNAEPDSADVTVTVRNKAEITVTCTDHSPEVYEGAADITLNCSATGVPQGTTPDYEWTAGNALDLSLLSNKDVASPTFYVPDNVDSDKTYAYTLTVSAQGVHDETANVTVTVLNKLPITVTCTDSSPEVYEGAADITLNCSASGGPSGATYNYVWTGRSGTVVPGRLSSATVRNPTFDVPADVAGDETYEYTLTVTADNAEDGAADVTVTVLDKKPLNVACATPAPVFEGAPDFALDCTASGEPPGSTIQYAWTSRGNTPNTDRLSSTTVEDPTFDVPASVPAEETYEYTLTVSAENAIDAAAGVTVRVLKLGSIALICESPPLVYEGAEDFALDCSVSGGTGNTDYTYAWTARGETQGTSLLSNVNIASPTFRVPDSITETTTYEYLLTASAQGVRDATAPVSVTVLNRATLDIDCVSPLSVYEGSADFALDCTASGAPEGSTGYEYIWTARGSTANTNLLSDVTLLTPTFRVPDRLDETTRYEYLLTVSAENSDDGSAAVTVTVLDYGALSVVCADPPLVFAGSENFDLGCEASGAPEGSEYTYVWAARGSTPNTDLLIDGTDGPTPTFAVPAEVDEITTYEYLLTVSADRVDDGSAEVTVTVLNREVLT
ncbi:MAG: hypothetical protein F4Z69_08455, partial [Bacteroidetes bacterium SB0668_bin_1]|nr:hypothetical protein [Bacteroidetes bacterium SB0668_bin_1]